jgi:rSAM/selenodomain-associated transferase 1
MTEEYAIVILGKDPIPGTVMTRLAEDIGNDKASQVQWTLALHLMNRLSTIPYPIVLQLKGDLKGTFANQCTELGVMVEKQATGTLTDKIAHASSRGKRTLIIGMDMPLIDVMEVIDAMREPHIVLGPADDGGYWLIGGTNLPIEILINIPWSTDKVWQSTVDKCTQLGLEYKVLSRQQDIDTLSDLSDLLSNPQCPASLRNDLLHILNTASPPL